MSLLILVVDDEPDVEVLFRQQFRRDLRADRFTMEFAQSAPMALQRIADAAGVSLILILSDINMPGMSGLELLPKAKALRPDVPVIMITAYGDAETKRQALESGAEALLTKPIATLLMPTFLSSVASACAELGQFDLAWGCISEATAIIETTKEGRWEAEVNRIAGEIARASSQPDEAAEAYFERALSVALKQQAKSFELRATMSLARLWRDKGKPQQARELLAPVYGWFTEGFDTRDLKEAKALLEELAI